MIPSVPFSVVKIAEALDVSLDELAGRVDATNKQQLRNPELHQLYQQVNELPDEDQQALMVVIDRLVSSSRISRAVAGTHTKPRRRPASARASRQEGTS